MPPANRGHLKYLNYINFHQYKLKHFTVTFLTDIQGIFAVLKIYQYFRVTYYICEDVVKVVHELTTCRSYSQLATQHSTTFLPALRAFLNRIFGSSLLGAKSIKLLNLLFAARKCSVKCFGSVAFIFSHKALWRSL